jgi:hypothetical protein
MPCSKAIEAAMNRFHLNRRQFAKLAGAPALIPHVGRSASSERIRIDIGRQLFVDDLLIADTSLRRTFHKPRIHEASPVLSPSLLFLK